MSVGGRADDRGGRRDDRAGRLTAVAGPLKGLSLTIERDMRWTLDGCGRGSDGLGGGTRSNDPEGVRRAVGSPLTAPALDLGRERPGPDRRRWAGLVSLAMRALKADGVRAGLGSWPRARGGPRGGIGDRPRGNGRTALAGRGRGADDLSRHEPDDRGARRSPAAGRPLKGFCMSRLDAVGGPLTSLAIGRGRDGLGARSRALPRLLTPLGEVPTARALTVGRCYRSAPLRAGIDVERTFQNRHCGRPLGNADIPGRVAQLS
jgi:hypothetical protein